MSMRLICYVFATHSYNAGFNEHSFSNQVFVCPSYHIYLSRDAFAEYIDIL